MAAEQGDAAKVEMIRGYALGLSTTAVQLAELGHDVRANVFRAVADDLADIVGRSGGVTT